jgi:hypothetical protein
MKFGFEMDSGGMIYILPKFNEDWYRLQGILRFCLSNLNGCDVGITDERDL